MFLTPRFKWMTAAACICAMLALAACNDTDGVFDVAQWKTWKDNPSQNPDKAEKADKILREALPPYWADKLKTDENMRLDAIKQLGLLGQYGYLREEDKAALVEMFNNNKSLRSAIADQWGLMGKDASGKPAAGEAATAAMLEKLDPAKGANRKEQEEIDSANRSIISALTKLKHTPAGPKIISFLDTDNVFLAGAAASSIPAFFEVMKDKKAEMEKGLLRVLGQARGIEDPQKARKEKQNWKTAQLNSIEALGKLQSTAAAYDILFFLFSDTGGSYKEAANTALFRIGEAAVQPINDTLYCGTLEPKKRPGEDRCKNPQVKKLVDELDAVIKQQRSGTLLWAHMEAKAMELLGDLANPKGLEAVLRTIEREYETPDDASRKGLFFAQAFAAYAGGRICAMECDPKDRDRLVKRIVDLMGKRGDVGIFTYFTDALQWIADENALKALIAEAKKPEEESLQTRSIALTALTRVASASIQEDANKIFESMTKLIKDKGGPEPTEYDAYVKKWNEEITKSLKMKVAERKKFQEENKKTLESLSYVALGAAMQKDLLRLELAKECVDSEDCYIKALVQTNPQQKRDRAAFSLARVGKAAAAKKLVEHATGLLKNKNVDKQEARSLRVNYLNALSFIVRKPGGVDAELIKMLEERIEDKDEEKAARSSYERLLAAARATLARSGGK
ncbi:MAG: hypothetical protein GMKNLPBB_00406 [Myxococcota bacterium]|nr:hypothetical protein [Myxococcota bacterium]